MLSAKWDSAKRAYTGQSTKSTTTNAQRSPVTLQRHIAEHLNHRNAHYGSPHPPRAKRHHWTSLHFEESSASENLLPPDRQTRSPPTTRVSSGLLPRISEVSAKNVSTKTWRRTFRENKYAETSQAKNICRNVSYDMWSISGVCTLSLTVALTVGILV